MDIFLYIIVLGVAINLGTNVIFKYMPGSDKRVDVFVSVALIIICVVIIMARKDDPKGSSEKQASIPTPSYKIVSRDSISWGELIRNAKFRVYATSILASGVDEQGLVDLVEKVKTNTQFQVKLILLKPNGKFVGIRADDEKMSRNPGRIADKLITLKELSEEKLTLEAKKRLSVKCIDVYPTISVIIIDHDLYAYFYPYRAKGTSSPVVVFQNIDDNTDESRNLVAFFQQHFQAIDDAAQPPTETDYEEYRKLSTKGKL